jgi:hypothetical protein
MTFCGAYGGNTFEVNGCPRSVRWDRLGSCVAPVAGHPEGMKEAFWDINSLNVWKQVADEVPATVATSVEVTSLETLASTIPCSEPLVFEQQPAFEEPSTFEQSLPVKAPIPFSEDPYTTYDPSVLPIQGTAGVVDFYADYSGLRSLYDVLQRLRQWIYPDAQL